MAFSIGLKQLLSFGLCYLLYQHTRPLSGQLVLSLLHLALLRLLRSSTAERHRLGSLIGDHCKTVRHSHCFPPVKEVITRGRLMVICLPLSPQHSSRLVLFLTEQVKSALCSPVLHRQQ